MSLTEFYKSWSDNILEKQFLYIVFRIKWREVFIKFWEVFQTFQIIWNVFMGHITHTTVFQVVLATD